MMKPGITFSWLGVYALAGLIGFLAGEGIYKILTTSFLRRGLDRLWRKKAKVVSEDAADHFDLMKDIAEKNKLRDSHFGLRMTFKRK